MDVGNGVFLIQFVPRAAGNHAIAVSYKSKQVAGSPLGFVIPDPPGTTPPSSFDLSTFFPPLELVPDGPQAVLARWRRCAVFPRSPFPKDTLEVDSFPASFHFRGCGLILTFCVLVPVQVASLEDVAQLSKLMVPPSNALPGVPLTVHFTTVFNHKFEPYPITKDSTFFNLYLLHITLPFHTQDTLRKIRLMTAPVVNGGAPSLPFLWVVM